MSTAETIERREERAPLTAEGLLRRRANQKPGITALADPPNAETLGLGRPRSFNYHQADAAVDALARFFVELGLVPGDVIAVQLPNTVLSPLTLLGAWRAGLTVAALPMLWRGHEISRVCDEIEPKALMGVSQCAGERQVDALCAIAASQLSVRFVLGFGPDLPDGVISLDEMLDTGRKGSRPVESRVGKGPLLVTFTARPGLPFLPVMWNEEELLAQGAMTVLALDLDTRDVILNPYPLTGAAGLALGLMPWLIGGATLVQHHPFDYDAFVAQLLSTAATVTALPAAVVAALATDGVLAKPQCLLRRLGTVWPAPSQAEPAPLQGATPLLFDLYPLGDLVGVVLRRESQAHPASLPLGNIRLGDEDAVFVETRLRPRLDGDGELLLRGPIVPHGPRGTPLARDDDGFVGTGLRGKSEAKDIMTVRLKADPELLRHGGVAIAASEFDELYQGFPGFLDAACFVLPDPVIGDRVFAAVVPRPGEAISLETLTQFLAERGVAPYKFPDRLLVVKQIPRDAEGRVLREQILQQV